MYNPIKAAQVIAYFALKIDTKTIDILKVIKLVYLADRESIARWGYPILDENRCSLPHGPVNSTTYSFINGEYDLEKSGWANYLEDREHHQVSVANNQTAEDLDELSEADIECLENVWSKFGGMGKWELCDWTHDPKNIPEWENPKGSSETIPLDRIMKFVGVENVEERIETIDDYRKIDKIFATL